MDKAEYVFEKIAEMSDKAKKRLKQLGIAAVAIPGSYVAGKAVGKHIIGPAMSRRSAGQKAFKTTISKANKLVDDMDDILDGFAKHVHGSDIAKKAPKALKNIKTRIKTEQKLIKDIDKTRSKVRAKKRLDDFNMQN